MKAPTMLPMRGMTGLKLVRASTSDLSLSISAGSGLNIGPYRTEPTGYDHYIYIGCSVALSGGASGVVPTGIGSVWVTNLSSSTKTVTTVNSEYLCWNDT